MLANSHPRIDRLLLDTRTYDFEGRLTQLKRANLPMLTVPGTVRIGLFSLVGIAPSTRWTLFLKSRCEEVLFTDRNQKYSIYAFSNLSGAVVERIAYTSYGQPTFMNAAGTVQSTSPNSIRYSYTGREWDASLQLHHFRARWMGPVTGRFLGRDPIGYEGSPYQLYEFLESKSLIGADLMGMQCCIHLWLPRTSCKVGQVALMCSGSYYSFWPNVHGTLSGVDPCVGQIQQDDESALGPPDKTECLPCDIDETAIAAYRAKIMAECTSGARKFRCLGDNCSSTVVSLLNAGTKCKPCPSGPFSCGCTNSCATWFTSGKERLKTAQNYFNCLGKQQCNPWQNRCETCYVDCRSFR